VLPLQVLELDDVLLFALCLLLGHDRLGCLDCGEAGGVFVGVLAAAFQGVAEIDQLAFG